VESEATAEPPAARGDKRLNPIKLRQMKERQGALEEEVARLETEIAECEAALSRFISADESVRTAALLEERRAELGQLLAEWEDVAQAIESES
jgi:hypothetical protein